MSKNKRFKQFMYRLLNILTILSLLCANISILTPLPVYAAEGAAPLEENAPSDRQGQITITGPFGVTVNTATGNLSYAHNNLPIGASCSSSCDGIALDATMFYSSLEADTAMALFRNNVVFSA